MLIVGVHCEISAVELFQSPIWLVNINPAVLHNLLTGQLTGLHFDLS